MCMCSLKTLINSNYIQSRINVCLLDGMGLPHPVPAVLRIAETLEI